MNRYAKMTLMRVAARHDGHEEGRRDYDHTDGYSSPESRFRDRDGREHYDNGRFAPMSRDGEYGGDPMDRDGYGYPHAEYMEPCSNYPITPYLPPVYEREGYQTRNYRPMNKIGFSVGGEMEHLPRELGHDYRTSAGYDGMEEMSQRQGNGYDRGQQPRVMPVFNRQMAEEWTSQLQNADGTRGPHFSMEKANEIMKQYNVDCDPLEFWVVINSLYSDYDQALKKSNASTLELYACLAKAWIDDSDAVQNKAAAYYTYIVRH